jgi:formate hydrogenlyase regulatory protein HycA
MIIPDKLPIMRMEDYHTHYLGKVADGRLFWGYQTFVFDKPYAEIQQEDNWRKHRKEYALVHTFDTNGNYLTTKSWVADSTTNLNEKQLEDKLEEFVKELGDIFLQDIEIKIFQTRIDNIIFGLVVDEETQMINLQPSSTISFQKPWDGEYNT